MLRQYSRLLSKLIPWYEYNADSKGLSCIGQNIYNVASVNSLSLTLKGPPSENWLNGDHNPKIEKTKMKIIFSKFIYFRY